MKVSTPGTGVVPNALAHKLDREPLELGRVVAGDQQLHLTALRRQGGEIRCPPRSMPAASGQLAKACHAVGQLCGREVAGPVDADTHHRSPHVRQPIRGQEETLDDLHRNRSHRRRVAGLRAATAAPAQTRAEELRRYAQAGGYRPLDDADALLEQVDLSGLLGRGGAAFPLGTKLRTVRDAGRRGLETVVVANGEEGEPASVKDRWLLRNRPHLVLDGLRLAAAIGRRAPRLCVRLRRTVGHRGQQMRWPNWTPQTFGRRRRHRAHRRTRLRGR